MAEPAQPPRPTFESFLDDHHAAALRFGYLLTGGEQATAEDLLQAVLVRILVADNWHQIRHPRSYLRRAVLNEWRTHARAGHRFRGVGTNADARPEPHLPDGAEATVDRLWIWRALDELSDRQRAAVILRYFADLDDQETADALGCGRATVRSLIHRALPKIAQALAEGPADVPGRPEQPSNGSHHG